MTSLLLFRLADSASNIINSSVQPGCTADGGTCPNATTLTSTTFPHVTNLILFFVGAIAIIMIAIGGLRYVISAGNPTAVNDAKNTILFAIIGLVVAASAYAIVGYVTGQFGL